MNIELLKLSHQDTAQVIGGIEASIKAQQERLNATRNNLLEEIASNAQRMTDYVNAVFDAELQHNDALLAAPTDLAKAA